jgi:hypothetical protein
MLVMPPPALVPFAAVAAALVGGPGAVFAAPAGGRTARSPIATHLLVSHPRSAIAPHTVQPAESGASAARGPGAGQTGLAASSAAAVTGGAGYAVHDYGRASAGPRAGSARIRAPPR